VILLARHGQTAYNREGRFQGHLPVPLDETGREQAQLLARRAADRGDVAALWCSHLARARETALIVAARLGLEPREDARLAETDCGDWTNRLFADVQAEDPEAFAAFVRVERGFRFPGGEAFDEQQRRVVQSLSDIRAAGPLPALVVSHGVSIRLALADLHGDDALRALPIANASLVEL
jgi:broad specificity phosphatase PhoE